MGLSDRRRSGQTRCVFCVICGHHGDIEVLHAQPESSSLMLVKVASYLDRHAYLSVTRHEANISSPCWALAVLVRLGK
jgi:hypothetical protein